MNDEYSTRRKPRPAITCDNGGGQCENCANWIGSGEKWRRCCVKGHATRASEGCGKWQREEAG